MTLAWGVLRDGGVCARIDGRVVDMRGVDPVFDAPSLNPLMAAGLEVWRQARDRVNERVTRERSAAGGIKRHDTG